MSELVFGVLILGILGLVLWISFKNSSAMKRELETVTHHIHQYLTETAKLQQQSGAGTVKAISDVYGRLGGLEESARKIFQIGEEISRLQNLLKAPKIRGGFGEWMLQDLLGEMIPREHFGLQYQFRSGTRVDAVVFVGDYLVPVDAKFPLENFERMRVEIQPDEKKKWKREFAKDIRKHVDDIAARYILPAEGTLDFALMYIPAESIYYEVLGQNDDPEASHLYQYAMGRKVIPVSPNSFYAYLQVILMGLKGLKTDAQAREIVRALEQMRGDFSKITEDLETLGSHITRTQGGFDRVRKGIERFDDKLTALDQQKESAIALPASEVIK